MSLCCFVTLNHPASLLGEDPGSVPLRSAKTGTVVDDTVNAFGFAVETLPSEDRPAFFVGKSFFNENWIIAPGSPAARDGLGPLFNARSCSGCHLHDGRSAPPSQGAVLTTLLLRLSIPNPRSNQAIIPEPNYGGQLQTFAIPGIRPEATALVSYHEVPGSYADGDTFTLRHPTYRVTELGYGPLAPETQLSPRVAPIMAGVGLLEAVSEADILSRVDANDRDRDGIRGRANWVWDIRTKTNRLGRLGWKAEQPDVYQQTATAFLEDIGITSSLHPRESWSAKQSKDQPLPAGLDGRPEISDKILSDVVFYARHLAVPAQRDVDHPSVQRGQRLFTDLGCAKCHTPTLNTSPSASSPALRALVIQPYTDLLLHDMGEGLSDHRPSFHANGADWRTPPLWGLGLIQKINGHSTLLHDGRARSVEEAILWHGGEGESAREKFRTLPRSSRHDLVAFLKSL